MVELTILRDNREQLPWGFEGFPVAVKDTTLETGDYTIPELCSYDSDLDTYCPSFAVERKTGEDLVSSIGVNRNRFKKEIKRAETWKSPLMVLIEEPKSQRRGENLSEYSSMNRNQIYGTIDSWEEYYNVKFRFTGSRGQAQRVAYQELLSQLQASLIG